jgi:hypothetical protein
MKTRELTTCSLLRRLSASATALVISIGAAQTASAQATNYSAVILADNPVAYYQLQELPGATTAVDSTTNGLNGAYNFNDMGSPELGLPGIDTNSILFTFPPGDVGDYGYVALPASPLLAPVNGDGITGAPFSAECWVQATTTNTPDYLVPLAASGPYGSGLYNDGSGWNFYQSQTSPQSWQVFIRTSNAVNIVGAGADVALLDWTYLALTWDGTNATFYVDGLTNASLALTGYLVDPGAADIEIGGPGETGHGPFEGSVTQVAFYTNVLTAAQVLNHYNVGTNNISSPLAAPSFVSEPLETTTNYSGVSETLTVLVNGSKPLTYQWYENNVPIPGATNNIYSFVPAYPADNNASYYVSVTNSVGSTNSTTNVLTLLTNINVIAPPYSTITYNVGSYAAFRTAVNGALPIGYQWYVSTNGGLNFDTLTNQTADTLWLTNVQLNLDGNQYWVVVTNPFTSYSNFAFLAVGPRAVNVPLNGYGAIVAADHPVAFYRLNEPTNSTTAVDAVGSFNAIYNNTNGPIDWQIPTGIPGDTNFGVGLFDPQSTNAGEGGVVDIPYALELNPYGNWSFEGWFEPTYQDPNNFRTVCSSMYNSNYSAAVFGWLIYQHPASAWTLVTFDGTGGPATFISDYAHIPLVINSWYHLVLVNNGTTIQLYVNGVAGSASGPSSLFIPDGVNGNPSLSAAPGVLAQRSDGAFFGFNGGVDEVAFYNYALSPAQILAHYNGKAELSYAQANGQITLTWPVGTLLGTSDLTQPFQPVSGATSPYTVSLTNAHFFYAVGVAP